MKFFLALSIIIMVFLVYQMLMPTSCVNEDVKRRKTEQQEYLNTHCGAVCGPSWTAHVTYLGTASHWVCECADHKQTVLY